VWRDLTHGAGGNFVVGWPAPAPGIHDDIVTPDSSAVHGSDSRHDFGNGHRTRLNFEFLPHQ